MSRKSKEKVIYVFDYPEPHKVLCDGEDHWIITKDGKRHWNIKCWCRRYGHRGLRKKF